ncbi:MAG: hypothetical protein ACRDMV_16125 [Streptosporangiales bacterium]
MTQQSMHAANSRTSQEEHERASTRQRSSLQVVAVAGLVVMAVATYGVTQTHQGPKEAISVVFALLPLALAGLLAARTRLAVAVTAAVVAAFYLAGAPQTAGEMQTLTHPALSWGFAAVAGEVLAGVVVLAASIGVALRARRLSLHRHRGQQ